MLRLLESRALLILNHTIEIVHIDDAEIRRKLRVAYNAIFHTIFNYRQRESVAEMLHIFWTPDMAHIIWEKLVEKCIKRFGDDIPEKRAQHYLLISWNLLRFILLSALFIEFIVLHLFYVNKRNVSIHREKSRRISFYLADMQSFHQAWGRIVGLMGLVLLLFCVWLASSKDMTCIETAQFWEN